MVPYSYKKLPVAAWSLIATTEIQQRASVVLVLELEHQNHLLIAQKMRRQVPKRPIGHNCAYWMQLIPDWLVSLGAISGPF